MKKESVGRVVHCKREAFDVYIGRPGPWGNPFSLTNEKDRQRVIEKYRTWILEEIRCGRLKEEKVRALFGKTLGCWCAPKACHGDVLLEIAERLEKEESLFSETLKYNISSED